MKIQLFLSPLVLKILVLSALAQSPGGVGTGMYLWVKAGAGVTQLAGQVSSWSNQAGTTMLGQAGALSSSAITLVSNSINYNPVIRYNGTQVLQGLYLLPPLSPPLIFAVATGRSGTGQQFVGNVYSNAVIGAYGMLYDATTGLYWVDGSGSECSATASTTNIPSLVRVYYASALTAVGSMTALNGVPSTACGSGILAVPTGIFQLGGRTYDILGRVFVGDIAEVAYYNANNATALQIDQIESYLALKYGITLGSTAGPINYTASDGTTVFWTGSSTYQRDIFGLGTDNGSGLSQTQSNSVNSGSGNGVGQSGMGNLTLSASSALSDKQFLLIGNDGGALTEQTTNIPVLISGSKRLARTWQVQNTGSVATTDLSFDMTGLALSGGATITNYRLMVNTSGSSNFTVGTPVYYNPASISGNLINFPGIALPAGAVFTLITFPGGILPVTWVNFTATVLGNSALLQWSMSDENNTSHYNIEESFDGSTFDSIGVVPAKNDDGINTYSFKQPSLPSRIIYFRIERVDADGHSSLSTIREVNGGQLTEVVLTANPVTDNRLHLRIGSSGPQTMSIRIFSMEGQLMQQTTFAQNGVTDPSIDISRLSTGAYVVQVQAEGSSTILKFIKIQ